MQKELLETFEAAKKAADESSDGGGPAAIDRCVDALHQLKKIPVSMKTLVDTQVGKRLRHLKKHPQSKIQAVASDLLEFWKNRVIEETSKNDKKNANFSDKASLKVEGNYERVDIVKVGRNANAGTTPKLESVHKDVKNEKSKNDQSRLEKVNGSENNRIKKISREEKSTSFVKKTSASCGTPKLKTMVKCNDPTRDKIREILVEAFSRVYDETSKDGRDEVRNILDEVAASDPVRVAVTVESAMFDKLGHSTGSQKMKYRSLMFNLKDNKNPDFRRRVLLGQVKPESVMVMTPEDMASDERKRSNQEIKEKALFDCERGGPPKATTDQFKCGRCGQRKTTYYQLQTRSADEPMTTFVTCVNCNNHWKFC